MNKSNCMNKLGAGLLAFIIATSAQSAIDWSSSSSGLWQDGTKWSLGAPPTNNADVNIINAGTKTVTIDAATPASNLTVKILQVYGPTTGTNSLILSSPSTPLLVTGNLYLLGFNDNSRAVLTLDGGLLVTTNLSANVGYSSGGVGVMTVSNGTWLSTDINVGFSGAGTRGELNLVGGTNLSAGTLITVGGITATATGVVTKTGGLLVTTNADWQLGRAGVGYMTVSGGTWLGKTLSIGRLSGGNGTLTITGGSNVFSTSFGVGSTASGTGAVTMTGGYVSSPSITIGLSSANTVGSFLLSSGAVLETSSLTVQTDAGVTGRGTFTNRNGGVLQFTTATPTITLNNGGSAVVSNAVISYRNTTSANIYNANVAKMTFQGNNTFQLNSATNSSITSYTFDSVANTGTATNYQRLALANGGRWQSSTLTIGNGGSLVGNGTVASDTVTNLGAIAPGFSAGSLTFTNNLVLGSTSQLQMEIGGASSSDYDRLVVGGDVTISRALKLTPINGFSPTAGDTFTIIDNQGVNFVSGQFDGLTNNAFIDASMAGIDAFFHIQYNAGVGGNDVILIATIPEPTSLMMLLVSGVLLLRLRSKQ